MRMTERPVVAITMGDPAGVGPEIVLKALAHAEVPARCRPLVIGDRRKYLTALFNIDLEIASHLAAENGIELTSPEELLTDPRFKAVLDKAVEERNSHLGKVETIKNYTLLKRDFSKDTGELTNTLKVKRKAVVEMYAKEIEAMYQEN